MSGWKGLIIFVSLGIIVVLLIAWFAGMI